MNGSKNIITENVEGGKEHEQGREYEEEEGSLDDGPSRLQRNSPERRRIMPSARRRLRSMPSRFVQTDEELHKQLLRKGAVRCSKSFKSTQRETSTKLEDFRNRSYTFTACDGRKLKRSRGGAEIVAIYKHENIYRGLLRVLLHPLGAPDPTVGLRPGDLLDHVREVFEVESDDHELYILEELPNKPKSLQVNIAVLEANGLKGPNLGEDMCNTYCILDLHNPSKNKGGNRLSPKITPTSSPHASPSLRHRGSMSPIMPDLGLQKTSTVKSSSHPKWNEEFTLDIEDLLIEEVHVYVCNQDSPADYRHEKSNAVKSFLGILRHNSEPDNIYGCIGKVIIPVRDISALGTDNWYDIVSLGSSKGKQKPIGKCHLRMCISYHQDLDNRCYFSSEDYYQAYRQFLNYTYKNTTANPSRHVDDHFGSLSLKDDRILKMFASAHSISKLSQAIVSVICLLEMQCEEGASSVGEMNLHLALDEVRMTWATMQIGQRNLLDRMPLTDIEVSNYRKVASKYIKQKCDKLDDLPDLFPPSGHLLNTLKSRLGVIVQLLSLDLWEPNNTPQRDISQVVMKKLQDNVNNWIREELDQIHERSREIKDTVIPEIERLINLVDVISSHCTDLPVLKSFCNSLGISYYRTICMAIEKQISSTTISIMTAMNKYMKRYNSFIINIMNASKLTLRLYFALRNFYTIVRDNVSRREGFRLTLSNYQDWFEVAMTYWLQAFQSECISRMEKALEIDKDVVVVTSLVKYSHSSVDVLSCFAQVIGEWRKIDFRDPDGALMGVTNITDMICNGATLYADKIHSILKRNCYYDEGLNTEFDVNDRLCITLNNIEHVRLYLEELDQLLAWDTIIMMVATKYGNDNIGKQALATLQRLIDMSNDEILLKMSQLLRQICEKMRGDMERFMDIFMVKEPMKASSVDQFLGYLSTNLQTLNEQLMPNIYPYMVDQLWNIILVSIDQKLAVGEHPDYYEQMKQHLRAVGSFFQRAGWEEQKLHTAMFDELKSHLDLNSKSSETLMSLYYHKLATNLITPPECYGHLAFKVAYIEETRGNVTIYVQVLKGSDLPGLDSSGFSDPYIEISLHPSVTFGSSIVQKTHVVKQTLNPVFNSTFQFNNISREFLHRKGACVIMTVLDHDTIGRDDFAGEVIVHMPSIVKISLDSSLDRMPAVIMPLKRPEKPKHGPYLILSKRDWDKEAKKFIAERSRVIDHQPQRTDKQKTSEGFFAALFASLTS